MKTIYVFENLLNATETDSLPIVKTSQVMHCRRVLLNATETDSLSVVTTSQVTH